MGTLINRLLFAGLVLLTAGCLGTGADMRAPVFEGKQVVGPSRSAAAPKYYFVKSGDTLYSIAWRENLDYRTLALWNRLPSSYTIRPGQRLVLTPPGASSSSAPRVVSSVPSSTTSGRSKPAPVQNNRTVLAKREPSRHVDVSGNRLRWQWPTNGRVVLSYSSKGIGRKGVRISGKYGQPVKAAQSGKVVYSGSGLRGYGQLIIVKHNEYYLSAYGNNRKILVKEGQAVKVGEKIAEMGNSDKGEPILHFEIRYRGKPVDPERLLPKR